MIFDSHCHLQFTAFNNTRDEVVKRCKDNNVKLVNVGTCFETSKKALELSSQHDFMYCSVGLHPLHIKTDLVKQPLDKMEDYSLLEENGFDENKYRELIKNNKKVVAIGEVGFDLWRRPKTNNKKIAFVEKQKQELIKQLKLAEEFSLPVIFHCRLGFKYLFETLKEIKPKKAVCHSFTGNEQELERVLSYGYLIGVNGLIFKLDWLGNIIKKTPLEKILIETDAPYLTPPQEGEKLNEPIFLEYVIQKIGEIKNEKPEKIEEITYQNAKEFFSV